MIGKLRSKFFIYAITAFLVAMFALVFFLNLFITIRFTDVIDQNLDKFMEMEISNINLPNDVPDQVFRGFGQRVFIVYFDDSGIIETKISEPTFIETAEADAYALAAIDTGNTRGWADGYRYYVSSNGTENIIIFLDGDFFGYAITSFRNISFIALAVTSVFVFVFMYFASKQAVKPMLESQERQKQFMTDASHELKTPLTVISASTEILRMNEPDNEWLATIERQTKTLTNLIQQIIKMSKLDESELVLIKEDFYIDKLLTDVVEDFKMIAESKGLNFNYAGERNIMINAHQYSINELIGIILDNAVKYCDENGTIEVRLEKHKKVHLFVSNSFIDIDQTDLSSIFNRFYRADSSRKSDGSYGLGLSIAASIVDLHHGSIKAYKYKESQLMIEITL